MTEYLNTSTRLSIRSALSAQSHSGRYADSNPYAPKRVRRLAGGNSDRRHSEIVGRAESDLVPSIIWPFGSVPIPARSPRNRQGEGSCARQSRKRGRPSACSLTTFKLESSSDRSSASSVGPSQRLRAHTLTTTSPCASAGSVGRVISVGIRPTRSKPHIGCLSKKYTGKKAELLDG